MRKATLWAKNATAKTSRKEIYICCCWVTIYVLYQCLKLIIGKQKYVKKLKNCLLQFLIHMLETEKKQF